MRLSTNLPTWQIVVSIYFLLYFHATCIQAQDFRFKGEKALSLSSFHATLMQLDKSHSKNNTSQPFISLPFFLLLHASIKYVQAQIALPTLSETHARSGP